MTLAFNQRPQSSNTPLISVADLKTHYLFGVSLKDDDGNELPDEAIEHYILSAQRWLEKELMLYLTPTEVEDERHDYQYVDYTNFGHVKALWSPITEVTKYAIQFPLTNKLLEFNPEWFKADAQSGQINLIPTHGTFSQILMGQGGSFLPLLYTGRDYIPYIIAISYKTGFPENEVPYDLLNIMAMKASIGPLNIAGDLIAGAGIASKSISIDGLSQSVGTTSSATNSGYGARIIAYDKQIKEDLEKARLYYKGITMVVG